MFFVILNAVKYLLFQGSDHETLRCPGMAIEIKLSRQNSKNARFQKDELRHIVIILQLSPFFSNILKQKCSFGIENRKFKIAQNAE